MMKIQEVGFSFSVVFETTPVTLGVSIKRSRFVRNSRVSLDRVSIKRSRLARNSRVLIDIGSSMLVSCLKYDYEPCLQCTILFLHIQNLIQYFQSQLSGLGCFAFRRLAWCTNLFSFEIVLAVISHVHLIPNAKFLLTKEHAEYFGRSSLGHSFKARCSHAQ